MRIRKNKNESALKSFEQFLKDYNCVYTVNNEESSTVFSFEFQAAHFVATIRKQDDCVEVTFPCMATAKVGQLDLVRAKCNERNNSNILFKFTYTVEHEDNVVNIHMSFFNNQVNTETIVNELKAAFHFQREWYKDFDEAVAISKDSDTLDLESELYKHQREMFMLRRLELRHQLDTSAASIATGAGPLPLWQVLETVSPLPQCSLLFMTVNTVDRQRLLKDEQEIRAFDLRRALIEGEGQEARLARDYAVLDLHYKQGHDEKPQLATITLTAEGDDAHAIYTRVTVTQVPRNASRMNSLSNERRQPHSVSLLIALDRNDSKKLQQEFDYMWTDARLKAKNGEQDNMTEEQKMLSQIHIADVAYNLYWGQQLFMNERYYEAIQHLENVYNSFRSNYYEMTPEHKRVFMEVAYKLGFCYNDLGLYKQAFYYLDLIASDGNIRHTMELVNTMANSKDLRLFSYTEGIMDEVRRNFEEDSMPDNIKDFINFLRRRRGYAFIEFNQLDQAEKIFTHMLNEEDNADYAINELAYIKKLREQRSEDISANGGALPKDMEPLGPNDLPF